MGHVAVVVQQLLLQGFPNFARENKPRPTTQNNFEQNTIVALFQKLFRVLLSNKIRLCCCCCASRYSENVLRMF